MCISVPMASQIINHRRRVNYGLSVPKVCTSCDGFVSHSDSWLLHILSVRLRDCSGTECANELSSSFSSSFGSVGVPYTRRRGYETQASMEPKERRVQLLILSRLHIPRHYVYSTPAHHVHGTYARSNEGKEENSMQHLSMETGCFCTNLREEHWNLLKAE